MLCTVLFIAWRKALMPKLCTLVLLCHIKMCYFLSFCVFGSLQCTNAACPLPDLVSVDRGCADTLDVAVHTSFMLYARPCICTQIGFFAGTWSDEKCAAAPVAAVASEGPVPDHALTLLTLCRAWRPCPAPSWRSRTGTAATSTAASSCACCTTCCRACRASRTPSCASCAAKRPSSIY